MQCKTSGRGSSTNSCTTTLTLVDEVTRAVWLVGVDSASSKVVDRRWVGGGAGVGVVGEVVTIGGGVGDVDGITSNRTRGVGD